MALPRKIDLAAFRARYMLHGHLDNMACQRVSEEALGLFNKYGAYGARIEAMASRETARRANDPTRLAYWMTVTDFVADIDTGCAPWADAVIDKGVPGVLDNPEADVLH